jgi:hypothetical protein
LSPGFLSPLIFQLTGSLACFFGYQYVNDLCLVSPLFHLGSAKVISF